MYYTNDKKLKYVTNCLNQMIDNKTKEQIKINQNLINKLGSVGSDKK